MDNLNQQIALLVETFVSNVSQLARKAAFETLNGALAGGATGAPARGRSRGRISSPRGAARRKGEKRPADELVQLQARVLQHVAANPGQRVEQINRELGTTTRELSLPLKKLIAEGTLRTEGEKRATAYFPAGRRRKAG